MPRREARDITHRSVVGECAVERAPRRVATRAAAPLQLDLQRATPYKTVTGARYQQVMPKEEDTPSSGIVERLPWVLPPTTVIYYSRAYRLLLLPLRIADDCPEFIRGLTGAKEPDIESSCSLQTSDKGKAKGPSARDTAVKVSIGRWFSGQVALQCSSLATPETQLPARVRPRESTTPE